MRTVGIVQARLGSSRLPGKALMALGGRPMLDHVLERALAMRGLDEVVLATSVSEPDAALQTVASGRSIRTYRGSEWDVLGRVREAAEFASADVIVRITADCPFWDPETGSVVLDEFSRQSLDYVSNDTSRSGYPDGLDVEIFTREALELAAAQAHERHQREHVTPWIRDVLRTGIVFCDGNFSHVKLSVDREEDMVFARSVYRALPPNRFGLRDTLAACGVKWR